MEKIKKFKNLIILDQNFICGSLFYTFEYLDYLLKNNIDTYLLLNSFLKKYYKFLIEDKYDLFKLHPVFFDRIIFFNELSYSFLKINNLFIFDTTTYLNINSELNKTILFKNLFYNYGNDFNSLKYLFNFKRKTNYNKFLIFGDKEMGCKVDYHYPLCLNFEIFKEIKNFDKKIWDESQKQVAYRRLSDRTLLNFHQRFDTLKYTKNEKIWERANRLIPECKFYNKKIIFEPKSYIDSAQLRYEKPWQYYDIWRFKSPDTDLTFADWVKGYQ